MSDEVDKHGAAAWLVRLESGSLSPAEREQFVDWLRESPANVAEMLHTARLHKELSGFSQWKDIAPLDTATDIRTGTPSGEIIPFPGVRLRRASSPRRWLAAAAAVAAVVVVSVVLLSSRLSQTVIATQVGERRELTLADRTEVSIAPDTKIRVKLSSNERLIVLEHGEVFFHVSQDPRRPFVVDAGHASALAVGTSFNVERLNDTVVVTVVEGRVAVSAANDSSRSGIPVGANQQVAVGADGHAAPLRQVNGTRETAWLQGQLIFDNDPVAEVVRRFNSYNHVQVHVADESLASRPVTGVFRATDPESFIAFLESVAGVRVRRADNNEIFLYSNRP